MEKIFANMAGQLVMWLALMLFFTLVAAVFPVAKGQKVFRKDYWLDLALLFITGIFSSYAMIFMLHGFAGTLTFFIQDETLAQHLKNGWAPLRALPWWAQGFMYLFLSDILLYWLHRWYHTMPMWRWHKLHHSATEMDWLTMARFHPINLLFYSILVGAVMTFAGFDPKMLAWLAPFNTVYSGFVHANWNLEFPRPLNYVLASPIFHRWHHTGIKEGGNKNFAPTFPILDVLFGTYYHPGAGTKPTNLGLDNPKENAWW